jgi:hypothetical protein
MMCEEWREIPMFDGRYEVSSTGKVYSHITKRLKKTPVGKRGYPVVSLSDENGKLHVKTVHRLVAQAFIPNPENKPEVNHIDGCKTNCMVDNLEWATRRENDHHARVTGLHKSDGDKSVIQKRDGKIIAVFKSVSEASRKTGISRSCIGNVCRGYVWNGRHSRTAGGFSWEYEK